MKQYTFINPSKIEGTDSTFTTEQTQLNKCSMEIKFASWRYSMISFQELSLSPLKNQSHQVVQGKLISVHPLNSHRYDNRVSRSIHYQTVVNSVSQVMQCEPHSVFESSRCHASCSTSIQQTNSFSLFITEQLPLVYLHLCSPSNTHTINT